MPCARPGLDRQVAIIASVLPLTSVEQARSSAAADLWTGAGERDRRASTGASDPAKEGIAIAAEMARQLKAIPGVRGIHILCGGCESAAAAVIEEAGLA